MADNLIFIQGPEQGVEDFVKVLIIDEEGTVTGPFATTESEDAPGQYVYTMSGAAGNYTVMGAIYGQSVTGGITVSETPALNVFQESLGSQDFRWDGTDFVTEFASSDLTTAGVATATNVSDAQTAITTAINDLETHGDNTWATATGFLTTLGANAPTDWINAAAIASAAVTKIQDGLPTLAQVQAAGFTTDRHNALIAADLAARALADGRYVIDYDASTAIQYNADGTVRTVFDLVEADGTTPATTAATAVERVPQ